MKWCITVFYYYLLNYFRKKIIFTGSRNNYLKNILGILGIPISIHQLTELPIFNAYNIIIKLM